MNMNRALVDLEQRTLTEMRTLERTVLSRMELLHTQLNTKLYFIESKLDALTDGMQQQQQQQQQQLEQRRPFVRRDPNHHRFNNSTTSPTMQHGGNRIGRRMYSGGGSGSGELRASGSASSFHIYASNNNDDAVEFSNDGDRMVSELVQENGTGAGAALLRSNFDSCGAMNTRHSNGIGIPFTSNGTGALQQQQQYNRHNNYKVNNNPGTNDYNYKVNNNNNIGNINNSISLHGGTPAPQLPAQQLPAQQLQLQQHNYNHHHLPRKHSSSSLADQRLIVDRENVELTFHHGSTVSLYSGTGVRSSSLVPLGNSHRMLPLTARARQRKQHIVNACFGGFGTALNKMAAANKNFRWTINGVKMLDNTEEVSSTQNGFFRNPSQPLKQTRGTCSRQPQRNQQWTARSMVGVYTDEEDEEEGDMEEDDDDDDGDEEVSTEDQRTDNEQYKEAREQLDEFKQQPNNGEAKAMTSSACAERTNLLPLATKCQSNSDANLLTQKGTKMASVQHQKQKQQQNIESSRSTSAENVTRKTSLADHQPPQQLPAQIAAGATTAINGMAPVVNKLSAPQLKKRPYNPIGAAVTFDACNGGTLLNGHSTTEEQNANNGQQEANNVNANNGQQEANKGQQKANNANANNGQQEANNANNEQQQANNANANNGQQEANNANNEQQQANNDNANNGQQEANNANNEQQEANNANANNEQQQANNANANNEQQQANNANANNEQQQANNEQQEANNANANNEQQQANNANNEQQQANNANANNEQQQQQMAIQQISANNEDNNNMSAMEEAKARQSVDQTVFDTDNWKTRRTARTRCDSV